MIITRLDGGLGNQLFQYAAGRRLAQARHSVLKLDLTSFDVNPARTFRLHAFTPAAAIATPADRARFVGKGPRAIWRRVRDHLVPREQRTVLVELHGHFDPTILAASHEVYLKGFWQSEKYFSDIAAELRRELTAAPPRDASNLDMAAQIHAATAVAVHVRRGDYVSDAAAASIHGACPPEYYEAAARRVLDVAPHAHMFVFSDDPQWAAVNLHLGAPTTFVTHNGPQRDHADLWLMSLCRHHIIANSTFSWWGAWLGEHGGQIVIAPRRWFANPVYDTRDLIPERWQTL